MQISTISIDLAKSVFQLMMFDNARKVVREKRLNRAEFYQFVQEHPPCAVVMEACGSAHYWAQLFEQHGFSVKLIPPQHVRAFVRGNSLKTSIVILCEPSSHSITVGVSNTCP